MDRVKATGAIDQGRWLFGTATMAIAVAGAASLLPSLAFYYDKVTEWGARACAPSLQKSR